MKKNPFNRYQRKNLKKNNMNPNNKKSHLTEEGAKNAPESSLCGENASAAEDNATLRDKHECDESQSSELTSDLCESSGEEQLTKALEAANRQMEEQRDSYLRLSAEFDNYRKRTMKEKAELILNGGEKTFIAILPAIDDFERALKNMENATDVAAVKEGVELIYTKFVTTLAQNGVKPIPAVGEQLDTDYHEAIAVVPAPDASLKGKIIDCVQTGYLLNNKVLRHAKVVVGE